MITNFFKAKIPDICLGERQDVPIEMLRIKDQVDLEVEAFYLGLLYLNYMFTYNTLFMQPIKH